jgi:hypothetical protein
MSRAGKGLLRRREGWLGGYNESSNESSHARLDPIGANVASQDLKSGHTGLTRPRISVHGKPHGIRSVVARRCQDQVLA